MPRILWNALLAFLAFTALARAQTESVKLRLSMQFAASEPFIGVSALQYKTNAEKAAANSLTVEIFDKGRLYIDDQVLDAVKSGAIEMGIVGINQIEKIVPAASILEQPFVFNFDAL